MPIESASETNRRSRSARHDVQIHHRAAWWTGLCTAILAAGFSLPALAQQYKSDPVDANALRNFGAALGSARGSLNYSAEQAKVEEYFTKGFFPEMSRHDPTALGRLGDRRFDLFRRYLWVTSNAQMQNDITEWAYAAMRRMAAPAYHPAVRYNAILTLGMLDAQYGIDTGANRRPPKPLPKANEFLVQIVNLGAAGNKVVSPPMLAGALIGLERHALYRDGLSPDAVTAMAAAALKIAAQDQPSLEMNRQVHGWMRLKAAGVLAQLGTVGTNNQVHDTLMKLVTDGRTLDDRCRAAALLAKINYEGAKIDAEAATKTMLALARDVATDEAKRAEEFRDIRFAGGGGFVPRGGGGFRGEGGGGFVDKQQDDYPRRPAVTRLTELKAALTALKPVVSPETQAKFDAIVAAVNPAISLAADKDSIALNVAGAMVTMAAAVKTAAGPADDGEADAATAASFEEAFDAPAEAEPAEEMPAEEAPAAAEPTATPPTNEAPAEAAPAEAQ